MSGGGAAPRPPRAVLFGCYDAGEGYPRPRLVAEALEAAGVDLVGECRVDPETTREKRFRAPASAGLAIARRLPALARRYRDLPPHDVVIVGPGGFLETIFLRRLVLRGERGRARPAVLFDPLYSLFDTVVSDRALVPARGLRSIAIRAIERRALAAADRVLVDTDSTAAFLSGAYGLPLAHFRRLRVGSIYGGRPAPQRARRLPGAPLDVIYVGSYIPLHGLDVVMAAAQRLRDSGVRFALVGSGQEERRIAATVRERDLRNVKLEGGFVRGGPMLDHYRKADAALGIFGTSEKAHRVVPFKVNDAMALGLPLVTADTAAAREVLRDGESALLVRPGSPELLAASLLRLRDDVSLRLKLGEGARRAFEATASTAVAAGELRHALDDLVPWPDSGARASSEPGVPA